MTRRHFLTTAMRAVLLATLLPFLPTVVQRVKGEVQPDGSVLPAPIDFNWENDFLKTEPFVWPHGKSMTMWLDCKEWGVATDGRFVCFDKSGNDNHLYSDGNPPDFILRTKELRIYPEVHSPERIKQEIRNMSRKKSNL